MTRSAFHAAYVAALEARAAVDPEYAYLAGRADAVADRMTASLAAGTADIHGSPVLRSLARTVGIPHTRDGWRTFAAMLED